MDADRKQELAEVKRAIKTAEARLQMHEESKNLDMAMKIQDEINKLMDQKLLLMQQQGENQPPENRKIGSCMATSQRNLGPFSRQSNESHAYPSRPFIAMSNFISFEPLIVPVSMPLPRCRLALDETF